MKKLITYIFMSIPYFGLAQQEYFNVHEWGTFTTLNTSDGLPLHGLFKDETPLPPFVYSMPFFSYDKTVGWPDTTQLKNVSTKMETPVLYFYTNKPKEIRVKVGFNGGTISQWYPQRYAGEAGPTEPYVDFARNYHGSIEWKASILSKDTVLPYSPPSDQVNLEWSAPRQTNANLIKGSNGEIEKYLFYRGIGNITLPIKIEFNKTGKLVLTNSASEDLGYVLVYEKSENISQTPTIWWQGSLKADTYKVIPKPTASDWTEVYEATDNFETALAKAGLYPDEARAMLSTWHNSYFEKETGLKVFWILPRKLTDQILPLELSVRPDNLERVIVGRSEILSPEMEAQLYRDYNQGNFAKYEEHKYYNAFLERMAQLKAGAKLEYTAIDEPLTGVIDESSSNKINLFPNPAADQIAITLSEGDKNSMLSLTIINSVSEKVIEVKNHHIGANLNIEELPNGIYLALISSENKRYKIKFLKK
ncbi:MAG TPA: T9SS type A sorting domain-containing protein [Cytophagaceae bacterium]|jgi:hypothetical protein